jgi:F-type H+-transporting ATPase subunit b
VTLLGFILAAAHAPASGGHAEESAGGLPQLDFSTWPGQIFWLAVAFGFLYFALSKSLLPKIGGVIEDRRDRIADDLDEAGRLQREAEESRQRHEKSLADARAKALAIAGETRARMAAELGEEAKVAEAAFAKKAAEADARIKQATDAALANVKAVAGDAAAALVEKLSGTGASAQAVKAAVDAADRR